MGVPLKLNAAGQFDYIFLFDSSGNIVTNPTIVAGDIQVALSDGGFSNLATLPAETPGGSGKVKVVWSQAETNGEVVILLWKDQAGDEWVDGGATWRTEPQTIGELATPADVNAQVLDVLNVDTFAEPGQGAPAATTTIIEKLGYLYKFARNLLTQTATTLSVYDDAGTTVDQKATVSDDGTTFTRGEMESGP